MTSPAAIAVAPPCDSDNDGAGAELPTIVASTAAGWCGLPLVGH